MSMVSGGVSVDAQFRRFTHELNFAMLIAGQCGVPACAVGPPGVGKTATMRALAKATARNFYSYELSRTQPEDLQGFPVVGEYLHDGIGYKCMQFVRDERMVKCELELSLLLIDEVSNVVASKQAPALNLVSQGLQNTWMYMAANPIESAADGQPLTCPFINRIWYGEWEVDEEAQDWGLTHGLVYPDPEIPLVPSDYMRYQPQWGMLVKDYFALHPKDRNACPKDSSKHKPWPSSRTWEYVTRVLAGVTAVGASEKVRDDVVMGLLGQTVGAAFIQHLACLELPNPADILREADHFKLGPRFDLNTAILSAVCNFLASQPTEEHLAQALTLRKALLRQNDELAQSFTGAIRPLLPLQERAKLTTVGRPNVDTSLTN